MNRPGTTAYIGRAARHFGALFALALLLLAAPSPVYAQAPTAGAVEDYRLENTDWNGLSSLAMLITHRGGHIEQRESIDLATLPDDTAVWIVAPRSVAGWEELRDWVWDGGQLVVADDFGSAAALAELFSLQRQSAPAATTSLLGNPRLPVLPPVGRHELTEGVGALVANHPSAFRGEGSPVVAFADGSGLVYDMLLGRGRAVFVSDASLLINLMLPLRDNARFVANVLAAQERPNVVLVSGDAALTRVAPNVGSQFDPSALRDTVEGALQQISASRPRPEVLHLAAILLAVGASALAFTVLPERAPRSWRPLPRAPRTSEFEAGIGRFTGRLAEASWAQPAALLRESLESSVWASIDTPPLAPDAPPSAYADAAARWVTRHEPTLRGAARRRRVRDLAWALRRLATLPRRDALLLGHPEHVTRRDVERMFGVLSSVVERGRLGAGAGEAR